MARNALLSPSSSRSASAASSAGVRSTVFVHRSPGGREYPEQPRKTPVLADRTCIARPHAGQATAVSVGVLGRMPSGLAAAASFREKPS